MVRATLAGMSNPDDDRTERDIAAFNEVVDKIQSARSKYTAMLSPHEPPPVTAQDAVDMIRYQRELVARLEEARRIDTFLENLEFKWKDRISAKTTVEVGPNGLIRLSFPIYPQMVQMQDYEEEPSDAR